MKNDLFSQGSQWIWMDSAADVNCYLQFQTEFQVVGEDSLVLHLTAEGQYVVFLDGNYLPSTQYPDFPHRKSVQRIEIPRLKTGSHTLEIQVWYSGADTSVTRREQPGLRFELRQGEAVLASSNEDVQVRPLAG